MKSPICQQTNAIVPVSRVPIDVRVGVAADLPFIDSLQKKHTKMVGWMPTKQLEGKIAAGQVLVAWAARPSSLNQGDFTGEGSRAAGGALVPLGYLISQDQYFKRDDVGIIYQLNVAPGHQRSLIGATLIKSVFERAAYGCRLFCCWCAQDIAANRFWESMGFIPLAYRAGSRARKRVHIFWQRRIVEGDVTTPYWFPSQTRGGSIAEDRLVLPIAPGTHWAEVMPILLPGENRGSGVGGRVSGEKQKRLPSSTRTPRPETRTPTHSIAMGGLRFADPAAATAITEAKIKPPREKAPKVIRPERNRRKNDPQHVAAARELRDRYLEQFNRGLILPAGKYSVGRSLERPATNSPAKLFPQAA